MADYAIHDTTLIAQADILRKKFGTSDRQDPADYASKMNLMGLLEEKTQASASVCSFDDGADDVPLKNWIVTLPASLDGYSEVNGVRTGKNLFDYEAVQAFNANVIITRSNGDYTMQNNNGYAVSAFRGILFHLKPATYSLSLGEAISVPIRIYKNGAWFNNGINAGNTSCTFTVTEEADYDFSCNVPANSSLTIKKCQFEVGSTATAYEAYSAPTTYTASLGRTIYGGQADIVNGEGESSYKIITVGNSGWNYYSAGGYIYKDFNDKVTPTIGDTDHVLVTDNPDMPYGGVNYASQFQDLHVYQAQNKAIYIKDTSCTSANDFYTKYSTMKIGYELATPTDFTFTGQEIPTKLGYNAFWSDEGDTEVTYRSSGTIHQYPSGEGVSF